MPLSLFQKSSPVRDGPKKTPLADRVPDMDTKTILTKHANTRRKATESFGATCIGKSAKLVTEIPFVGPFIPVEKQVIRGRSCLSRATHTSAAESFRRGAQEQRRTAGPLRILRQMGRLNQRNRKGSPGRSCQETLAKSLRLAGLGTGVRGRRQNFRNLWAQELCKVTSQLKLERQTGSGLMDGLLS